MVHGYGASAMIFFKILKPLVEAGFHLALIDILGMGSSSRPHFDLKQSQHQAEQFFVDFLEAWRIAMCDLKDFFLAGHSFGGFICGLYAL